MAAKNTMSGIEHTPRKVPFSDKTNKSSDLLKSAIKLTASQSSTSVQQTSSGSGKTQEKEITYDDFEPFVFPPDNNCFCCGDNRKSK